MPSYSGSYHYDDTIESEDNSPDNSFMFASQQQHTHQSLYPTSTHDSPHSWPPSYDQTLLPPFQSQPLPSSYRTFPTPAPYPAPRLSSPLNTAGGGHVTPNLARFSLAGSLDPATGIFYRTPEHPRLRTAQACEKCRTRKAKCSGEHPSCKRCINRGLVCEYAKEGRVRGPNKVKSGASTPSLKSSSVSTTAEAEQSGNMTISTTSSPVEQTGVSSFPSDRMAAQDQPNPAEERSPSSPSMAPTNTFRLDSPSRLSFTPLSQHPSPHPAQLSQEVYSLPTSSVSSESSSRRNSVTAIGVGLGEHRASRPPPPHLSLDATGQWRAGSMSGGHQAGWITQPPNDGPSLDGLTSELPMDFQTPQQQYERQCLVRQQHQRYLQGQRRLAAIQQTRMLQQHQSAPAIVDYQDLQQSSSLPMMSAPAPHRMNSGVNSMFQTQYPVYTPSGEYEYPGTMNYPQPSQSEMHAQGYSEESQVAAVMTHQESYQRATTGLESTEQGLHPSISRIEKRLESMTDENTRGEHLVGSCPSSLGQHRALDEQSGWV